MATNLTNLTQAQQQVVTNIINQGRARGYSDTIIQTVVNLANQESTLDPKAANNLGYAGLFQFSSGMNYGLRPDPFPLAINQFVARYPNDPISVSAMNLTAADRLNPDIVVPIMLNRVAVMREDFDNRYIPIGTKDIADLAKSGIDVKNDFQAYVFKRHNSKVNQTIDIFTQENNLPATNAAAAAQVAANKTPRAVSTVTLTAASLAQQTGVRQLVTGANLVTLPNGATYLLTAPQDSVVGNGTQFLVTQGSMATYTDMSTGLRVECSRDAFRWYSPSKQQNSTTGTNGAFSNKGAICSIDANGLLDIQPMAPGYLSTFKMNGDGLFIDPKKPTQPSSKPFDYRGKPIALLDGDSFQYAGTNDAAWSDEIYFERSAASQSDDPTTSTVTLNIDTTGTLSDEQVQDITSAVNTTGQVAGAGDDWSLLLAENTANLDDSYYGGVVSDAGADGHRLGNGSLSGTSGQTANVAFASDALLATLAEIAIGGVTAPGYLASELAFAGASLVDAGANTPLVPADPLVLDLNGDGIQLQSYASSKSHFDIDNDGAGVNSMPSKEHTGWVAANTTTGQSVNTDGIVVHDLNGDGQINGIRETLSEFYNGNAGLGQSAGQKTYADGFAALKSLDANNDQQFNNLDAAWSQLRVWVDDDGNGLSFKDSNGNGLKDAGEASELKTFAELGITSINLDPTSQSGLVNGGNEVLSSGSFVQTVNGSAHTRAAQAVRFIANPNGSSYTQTTTNGVAGATLSTQGHAGGADLKSYVSANTLASVNETLSASSLNVANIYAGAGDDVLTGDAGANWLAGGAGSDTFNAGEGDDVLLIDAADAQHNIHAGAGNDVVQVVGGQAGSAGVTLNMTQSEAEVFIGGTGDDVIIGGGRSTVFVRGGAGDDLILGGAANDVLSGEDGDDTIDGGAGNDLIRGHRGQDQLLGGQGDDVLDGGLEDDSLSGGAGNDVLVGGRGDDSLDGGDGIDVAQYSGSYADYRITRISDANGANTFRVVDTRSGQDGADTLSHIEKLSFSDVSRVDLSLGSPLPVKDILRVNSTGQALSRSAAHLLSKTQLLANDRDWDSDVSQLSITAVLEAKGGTASLTAQGDVLFTPDATYTGVMSFKYKVKDAQGNFTTVSSGEASEAMKAAVYLQTSDIPSDPLSVEQWYLADTNVLAAWGTQAEQAAGQGYSGKGVRIGQFEPGGAFSTGPEVFDYRHADLQQNVDNAWLNTLDAQGNNNTPQTFSSHATMVAGVMVSAKNGEGGVGVAYNASLAGNFIQGTGLEVSQLSAEITAALAKFKNYDVVNNSWGATANFGINVTPVGVLEAGLLDAVANGRAGLGTAIVMAGGNDRATGANTNTNALTANRAVITVGSINAPGDLGTLQLGSTPFSNPGASILVSAPGSNIDSTSRELVADNGSTFGGQYSTSQGTSFAAPIVSGVIALMLEANPNLGYRDIQTILAMTATQFDDPNGTDWRSNGAKNWNGGGMHASHDYGFGKVDARAAVRLAETWGETSIFDNQQRVTANQVINQAIPDGAGSLSSSLVLAAGLSVEYAQVSLQLNHANWGDLVVKLISPTGTESILVNRPGKAPGSGVADTGNVGAGTLNFSFGSTHILGEDSGGTWTLQVIDARTGQAGTLTSWTLDVYGKQPSNDDVYVYTNEYAATASGNPSRQTLVDSDGGSDTFNAAAMSGNNLIDLNAGVQSRLNGQVMTVALGTTIEQALGGDGNDTLIGNAEDNRLVGGRGNDILSGGAGRDLLDGGYGNDSLTGGAGQDMFMVEKAQGSVDTVIDFDAASEKIALAGFGKMSFANLQLVQEGLDTRVMLGDGQSIVLRNVAPASLGASSFVFVERQNISGFSIGSNASDPEVAGTGLQPRLYLGEGGDDRIFGGQGVDEIHGGDGQDVLVGEPTNVTNYNGGILLGAGDVLYGDAGDDMLLGGVKNDVLRGGAGNDYVQGDAGDDTIYVEGGEDRYQGLFGYYGNAGTDRFVIEQDSYAGSGILRNFIGDFDVNQAGEKIDLSGLANVRSFADLRFMSVFVDGVEFTRVYVGGTGSNQNITLGNVSQSALRAEHFIFATTAIEGTAGADALTGNAGSNTLNGMASADAMTGRTGDDFYTVDNVGDSVNELPGGGFDTVRSSVSYTLTANVENLTLSATAAIDGTGNDQVNRLVGNSADNVLDGKGGMDVLVGGAGNDSYVVDNQADRVIEQASEGIDTVRSAVSYTLGNNIENLTLTGTDAINATGNALANMLNGNAANNLIDGAAGADTMAGAAGDDTYFVDNTGDVVIESLNDGIDTVITSVNYTLGANVENLTLAYGVTSGGGNALDNMLNGNSAANTLSGGGGNDTLEGGAGADTLMGGAGDDVYSVDSTGDAVFELAGEGNDTIVASISMDIAALANVENVILTGTANLNATGNGADNQLMGNAGSNTLTGGAGADTLIGGAGADMLIGGSGDDIYEIDSTGDVIVETAGAGSDTVIAALTIDLNTLSGGYLEHVTLTGFANLNATGNAADNRLTGNTGNNVLVGGTGNDRLDGGWGADTLIGGAGNDNYEVDNALDVVQEAAGEGTDSVLSSVSYTLGTNLENLTLTGAAAINGTGNASANTLAGNAANNVLSGGLGKDTYVFGLDSGNDVIEDVDTTSGNVDRVVMGAGIVPGDVTVTRNLTHLFLNIGVTGQTLAVLWVPEQGKAVEQVAFANGTVWDLATLKAMANFAPQLATSLVDKTASEDQPFSFKVPTGTFSDLDVGDSLSLTATLANGNPLPAWLTFTQATRTFSGTPGNSNIGSLDIKVTASDGRGAKASDVFQVTVVNTNDAPVVANPLVARLATDGQRLSFAVPVNTFADSDVGDSLTYTATLGNGSALPTWLAFDGVSRTFSGTPGYGAVGGYVLRVTAKDTADAAVSSNFSLTVQTQAASILGTGAADAALSGTTGVDIIDGLTGNDLISGGTGSDMYLFRRGSGHDTITDADATSGNTDRIRFSADIVPSDITVTRTVYDLELQLNGTSDRVTLANWFNGEAFKIEQVEFANGTVWGVSELTLLSTKIAATDYQDKIIGTSGADTISALGGRDLVNGLEGNDTIDGGAGDDHLYGGLGNDTFLFGRGSGRDTILNDTPGYSSAETAGLVDTLKFAPDVAPSDVEVSRDEYNLILTIKGTQDQVTLASWFSSYYPAQLQRVEFANGTVWNTAALTAFVSAPTQGNDYLSGTTGNDTLIGLGGDDNLSGGNGNDSLDGGAGNDVLNGGNGNDTYFFGNGYGQDVISDFDWSVNSDRIVMQSGVTPSGVQVSRSETDLYLSLNGGADKLTVSNFFSSDYDKVERIEFSDSTVWDVNAIKARLPGVTSGNDILQAATTGSSLAGLGGNDILSGDVGADTLDGGAGSDVLKGGRGNDTYLFGRGYGQDVVSENGSWGDASDTLLLGAGIATTDIKLGRDGLDLLLSINGTGDSVRMQNWFDSNGYYRIDRIQFADATVWTASTILSKLATPTTGDDVIVGTNAANTLPGLGGNDRLFGDAGNDTLDGGTGNDVLFGGDGTDTYVFGNGYGQDVVSYVQPWDTQGDTVQFQAGVTPAGVTVTRGSSDLYLSLNGGADRLTLQGWFDNPYYQPQLRFFDGTIWTDADIYTRLSGITEGADIYGGGSANDTINGLGGNDILLGGDGDDVIDGGTGNDVLNGQARSDVFLFGRDHGRDVVVADLFGGSDGLPDSDTVRFKADVMPNDVVVSRNQDHLYLAIKGTDNRVTLKNWFVSNYGSNVDQVEFANGTSWNRDVLVQMAGNWPQMPKIETPLSNQTVAQGSLFQLLVPTYTFADNDLPLSFSAVRSDGSALPGWLQFNAATRTFSGKPGNADVGSLTLKVIATDGNGASGSNTFALSVLNINDAPVLYFAIADQAAT
ncbi:calcium-binding protein, partial [Anabaena sp. PCC 7938]